MSHLLEIPNELYAALQAAADASGTTPLGWIAAQLPHTTGAGDAPLMAALKHGLYARNRGSASENIPG